MLTKRIIPCLDIKNGRTVKGVNFVNLIDAGDPVILAKQYAELGADEFLKAKRSQLKYLVKMSLLKKLHQQLKKLQKSL